MSTVVVAAAQLPACGDDPARNLAVAETAITEAAARGADLVVLPELATTPYFAGEPAGAYTDWAEPVTGPHTARIAALSARLNLTVVFPFFERDEATGRRHNSAVVLDRGSFATGLDRHDRRHPVARKLHLPVGDDAGVRFDEPAHFTAGERLGVYDAATCRFGVLICYDRRFPECWRELRALGADLAVVPVAGSGGDSVDFFHAELRTHARENGVFAVAANKIGVEWVGGHRVENFGASCVVGPDGEIIAARPGAAGPGLVVAEIDIGSLGATRRALRYFDHRRTDLFPCAEEVS